MRTTRSCLASALTYSLGRSLYVPLTSRCNTVTLPETRGPGFLLPPQVVSSLLRVRDLESGTQQWHHWCMYLDTVDHPQKLPPALEPTLTLGGDEQTNSPFLQTLLKDVDCAMKKEFPTCLVLSGEGEPTLRWKELLFLAQTYSHLLPVRVTTNGLLPCSHAVQLKKHGVHTVSVALMTAHSQQYTQLMKPTVDASSMDSSPHALVCDFIRQAVSAGLNVEVTGVDRPDSIDKEATETLAASLGVTRPVRWRPYFC